MALLDWIQFYSVGIRREVARSEMGSIVNCWGTRGHQAESVRTVLEGIGPIKSETALWLIRLN